MQQVPVSVEPLPLHSPFLTNIPRPQASIPQALIYCLQSPCNPCNPWLNLISTPRRPDHATEEALSRCDGRAAGGRRRRAGPEPAEKPDDGQGRLQVDPGDRLRAAGAAF